MLVNLLFRFFSVFLLLLVSSGCSYAAQTSAKTTNKVQQKNKVVVHKKTVKAPLKKPVKPVSKKSQGATKSPKAKSAAPIKKVASKKTTPKAAKQVKKTAVVPKSKTTPSKKTPPKKIVSTKRTSPRVHSVKKKSFQSERLIILDAGHGGYDLGCRLASCNEKSLALSTTLMAKKYLNEKGYKVILTRSRDVFLTLKRRTQIANETKSKLFVSFHFNAAKNTAAKGIEVFYYQSKDKWRSNSSKKLAVRVLSKMIDRTGANNRGVKVGNFHVIRETKMPAVLIEGGFITHEGERNKLKDINYRSKLARAVADGIDSYFNL